MAGQWPSGSGNSSISIPGFDPSKYGNPNVRRESLAQSHDSTHSQRTVSTPPKIGQSSEVNGHLKVVEAALRPTPARENGVSPGPGGRQINQSGQEAKEEQLRKLQNEQLRKIGSRIKQKGSARPTTSLEDLELARMPLSDDHLSEPPHISHPNGNTRSVAKDVTPTVSDTMHEPPTDHQAAPETSTSVAPLSGMPNSAKSSNKIKNARWATPDELKPVLMDTHSNAWGSDLPSDASTADSDSMKAMHQGRLFKHCPPAEVSTSLVGWDGNWQPPPVDWNERPRFNNNSLEYRNGFNNWLSSDVCFDVIPAETVHNVDLHADGLGFVGFKEGVNERNASRKYGFTSDVTDIVRHVAPLEEYEYKKDWGKLDLSYSDNARFRSETTDSLVTNWVAQKTRRRQLQTTPQPANHASDTAPTLPEEIKPKPAPKPEGPTVNIYLRPAVRTDTEQLTELYNWYVKNSPRVTDIELIHDYEMRGRIEECLSSKLPFIVAVSREHKSLRRLKGAEKIVGFASATDFSRSDLSERISAELEVYVHPDWIHKGIGMTLIDKLLDSTDRGHLRTSTVTFTCDPDVRHLYTAGGGRDLNMLIFIIRHFKNPKAGAGEDIDTLKKWLADDFDFEESGCIKGAGTKFKRLMNMTYMTKETKWQPPDGNVPDPLNTC